MPLETLSLEARVKTVNTVLTDKHQRQNVDEALRATKGDMPGTLVSLKGKLPGAALQKVAFAHSLAADLLDSPSENSPSHGAIVTYFKRAFPTVPLRILLEAGAWTRVSDGGLTDQGFNELLRPWLRQQDQGSGGDKP